MGPLLRRELTGLPGRARAQRPPVTSVTPNASELARSGQPPGMEGGVGIILLLVILVVVIGIVVLYVTGGAALSGAKKDKKPPRERAAPEERHDIYTGRDS